MTDKFARVVEFCIGKMGNRLATSTYTAMTNYLTGDIGSKFEHSPYSTLLNDVLPVNLQENPSSGQSLTLAQTSSFPIRIR